MARDRDPGMAGLDLSFTPRPAIGAHTAIVGGDAVILDETRERMHVLGGTGTLVWQCFDGAGTLAEIASDLSEAFGAPFEVVAEDVLALTRSLGRAGLIAGVDEAQVPPTVAGPRPGGAARDPRFVGPPPST